MTVTSKPAAALNPRAGIITYQALHSSCMYLLQTVSSSTEPVVLLDTNSSVLEFPTAGHHVISISLGEVIDIVVVNEPADSYNGDLT